MSNQDLMFTRLMGEVLDNLGLAGCTHNADGVYTLGVNDIIELQIWCPDGENVFLLSSLGKLPEDGDGASGSARSTAESLLRLNAIRRRRLPVAWLSEEGEVVLWLRESLQMLTQSVLTQTLNDFMDHALYAETILHEKHEHEESGENVNPLQEVTKMHHAMKA